MDWSEGFERGCVRHYGQLMDIHQMAAVLSIYAGLPISPKRVGNIIAENKPRKHLGKRNRKQLPPFRCRLEKLKNAWFANSKAFGACLDIQHDPFVIDDGKHKTTAGSNHSKMRFVAFAVSQNKVAQSVEFEWLGRRRDEILAHASQRWLKTFGIHNATKSRILNAP